MKTNFTLIFFITTCCLSYCFHIVEAKTIFRRADKISENFKQLNLPPEETDVNVAPPEPQKPPKETITENSESVTAPNTEEILDQSEDGGELVSPSNVAAEVIDEAANEVDNEVAAAVTPESTSAVLSAASDAPLKPAAAEVTSAASLVAATTAKPIKNENDLNGLSKYCKCKDVYCDCCRDFGLPLLPVRGPGCARLTFLGNEKISVSIKYGDITLASRTISAKNARPICIGLPGGYSQFCGRVYGLSRAKDNFKACLGFELRADDEIEAALRVSCFKLGREGLRVSEAEPLPSEVNKDEDDDDDSDDIFGFGAGGDADDYDETENADTTDEEDDYSDDNEPEAAEDADYGGFSLGALLDELDDDEDETTAVKPVVTNPAVRDISLNVTKQNDAAKSTKDSAATVGENVGSSLVTEIPQVTNAVTSLIEPIASTDLTNKNKRKKDKKNKKNKASTADTDFPYELINGILDFFN